jgi:hypothetical protein
MELSSFQPAAFSIEVFDPILCTISARIGKNNNSTQLSPPVQPTRKILTPPAPDRVLWLESRQTEFLRCGRAPEKDTAVARAWQMEKKNEKKQNKAVDK